MSLNHFLHEKILLPISDIMTGQQVGRYLNAVGLAESWPDSQMKAFQRDQLRKLICYAAAKVPFYRDWFQAKGLNPNDVAIESLPIVNKTLMRKEGLERFAAEDFTGRQRITSRSSGSTGEPFTYYETKLSYSVNMAAKLRTWYQAGYRLGNRYMKIANGARHGKLKNLQDRLNGCIYVPFYSINNQTLKTISDLIEKKRPTIVRSYPAPLYLLAQYRNDHPEYTFTPQHLMTTGSTLPEAHRETIERAFGCDVIDSYSCEGVPNVYETTAHDGYHITEYYGIIEVLDEHDQPVVDGIGRVVSTDLWNYAMPFMRYDTQDLVEVQNGRICRIVGRDSDVLVSDDGEIFTNHNFSHFFLYEIDAVDTYQIVKHKDQSVTFRLVVNPRYNADVEAYIIQHWGFELGFPVRVEVVDEIPLMDNNKRMIIINENIE